MFTMDKGALATFREFSDIDILPIEPGKVGGIHNASSFTDMLDKEPIPAGGYMDEEPGSLHYYEDSEVTDFEGDQLGANLFVDEAACNRLAAKFSSEPDQARSVHLSMLVELFELDGRSSRSEYGFLLREGRHYALARLDSLTVVDEERPLIPWDGKPERPTIRVDAALDQRLKLITIALWVIAGLLFALYFK